MFVSHSFFYQTKFTRWLLTITLFLNIFAFSANSTFISKLQLSGNLTEWIIPVYSSGQKAISLKRAAQLLLKKQGSYYSFFLFQLNQLVFRHNQLYRVRFAYVAKQHFRFKTLKKLYLVKTIPAFSKEDPLHTRLS